MVDDSAFPHREFAMLGYEAAVHGRGGGGGVALISQVGFTDVVAGVPGATAPFDEPRIIAATVQGFASGTCTHQTVERSAHHHTPLSWPGSSCYATSPMRMSTHRHCWLATSKSRRPIVTYGNRADTEAATSPVHLNVAPSTRLSPTARPHSGQRRCVGDDAGGRGRSCDPRRTGRKRPRPAGYRTGGIGRLSV